jgi:AcrR family transcriptional regulator
MGVKADPQGAGHGAKGRRQTRTSSTRMSGPGLARRQLLLKSARKMLRTTPLADLSLGEVAKRAKVPKGSAYFFYEDINALCASLVVVLDLELQAVLREPLREKINSWEDIVIILMKRGGKFLQDDPAACQLLIGKDAPPSLKLIDRANDVVLGRVVEEHIASRFELPDMPDRPKLFFRAVAVADLMFSLSMIEYGKITKEYADEGCRAAVAYLGSYIPRSLPVKENRQEK